MNPNNEQLIREEDQHKTAFNKFKKAQAEQELKNDGSNTGYARHWKRFVFEELLNGLQKEIDDPGTYIRSSKATQAVKQCLGIPLVTKKRKDTGETERVTANQRNYFDLELCAFVALQMVLDNALCKAQDIKTIDRKTGKLKQCYGRKNRDELIRKIGERVEQQLYFKYVNDIFPEFFRMASERAEGGKDDMPRSSSYYWRYNMKRAIQNKKEWLIKKGETDKADLLDWQPFQKMEKKHIGLWLVAGCLKYTHLFKEQLIQEKASQQSFIVLSDWAQQNKEDYFSNHQPFIWEDLPMICLPVEATSENYGSWLTTVEQSKPDTNKGHLNISDVHLEYINRLQSVAYKINPFVADVMDLFYDKKIKLGKFKPHEYVSPAEVNQRLGLAHIADREEQTKQVVAHPFFKEAKRERSIEEARQVKKLEDAIQSRGIYLSMCKLRDYQELFFPYSWDFRGRAYCRCVTSPSPQGADYSKALLKFAVEHPLDNRSKHYLSIELANNAGQDKLNFDQRLKWTAANEANITLVATMLEDEGDFSRALSFLESIAKENPWQFLAAAEEYYRCFIKKDRHTTSIRCGMDMSCSGAGLMAGIRRCKTGAILVNVYPTNEPQDLYRACWDALVELNKKQDNHIRPELLTLLTEQKHGRAIAKKMIMVAQYSAGLQKQMMEFYEYHDELPEHLQLTQDEVRLFRKLWSQAVNKVCSFSFVVDWFQDRVQEIFDSGKTVVNIPMPTGSTQVMRYPIYKPHQVKSFHHGSLGYTKLTEYKPTDKPDLKKWNSSITANAIHSLDASCLALGLKQFSTLR